VSYAEKDGCHFLKIVLVETESQVTFRKSEGFVLEENDTRNPSTAFSSSTLSLSS
jgi:hypothetical protein